VQLGFIVSFHSAGLRGLLLWITLRPLSAVARRLWVLWAHLVMGRQRLGVPAGPHRNRTNWVSPVLLSRTIRSRPAWSWASRNSYDVIARLAMSVLDKFVRA
jgi:hypothetical protein